MAQESCNLDKDEAEILKPSSPPSSSSSPSPPPPPLLAKPSQEFPPLKPEPRELQSSDAPAGDLLVPNPVAEDNRPAVQCVNRCFSCRKRVRLTGFRCRCGHLFCPRHRYSDTHDCSFDYKAAGRAEIFKNNPLIRAAKIIKI